MTRDEFLGIVNGWINSGKRVGGPARTRNGKLLHRWIASPAELDLNSPARPANSIKHFFFPAHERLFGYALEGKQVRLAEAGGGQPNQIVIAARPCDAAALPILDPLFNWDCADEFYNRRRLATTVVTLACTSHDDACFCTSVGSGPTDTAGSDAMLFADGAGGFRVTVLTDKGRALFGDGDGVNGEAAPGPRVKVSLTAAAKFLAGHFEDSFWRDSSLACLGCGACAFTCPTCHCFDIVDEGNARGGWRVKHYDSCQFPMFTAHASGHNPRSEQGQRQRQRIYHKFDMYPRRFGKPLCTGCGNCVRSCPAGLGVLPVLEAISE